MLKEVYDSLGRCIVAVSEGIHNKDGEYFLQTYASETGSGLAGKKIATETSSSQVRVL